MLREDNNGFVHFPIANGVINRDDDTKTFVYLIAFDVDDMSNKPYVLSNTRLFKKGEFTSDDINANKTNNDLDISIDDLISNKIKDEENERIYFPKSENGMSIPMTTCICIGWINSTFDFKDGGSWSASFRDLTNEGMKLYYSIKKLHNNKEVRILTFNNI